DRRSRKGALLDAGRSLCRRRRACGAPPALCALLAQGALRHWHRLDEGTVPQAVQSRDDPSLLLDAGKYHEPDKVTQREGHHFAGDIAVTQKIEKMSKSRFNVVNPDDIVAEYGADSLRLYEMFMGPLEMTKPWQTSAVHGMRHFLERAWRLVCEDDTPDGP